MTDRADIVAALAQGLRHHVPTLTETPIGETTGLRSAGLASSWKLRSLLDGVCAELGLTTLAARLTPELTVGQLADMLADEPRPRARELCLTCGRTAASVAELMARCLRSDCEARAVPARGMEIAA